MKQAVLNMMKATGAFAPFRFVNRNKALVVMYHRISHTEKPGATSAHAFAEQLEYLTTHYRLVPLSVLAESLSNGRKLEPGTAAITIDDGYRDTYEIAFPLLRHYDAPATVFVVTDFVDGKTWLWTDKLRYLATRTEEENLEAAIAGRSLSVSLTCETSRLEAAASVNSLLKSLPDREKDLSIERIASSLGLELPATPPFEFSSLTWEHLREMDSAGIEIGSHTVTHPVLTNITREQLRWELGESRARIASVLDHDVKLFCYPNGDSDPDVRREVERAGYTCAVTTAPGFNDGRS
ncbi:MAG: polysaccharide deacetylase family protein, partial [Blastocatellia bacterium]|nr:polysaccharide deacetylase family protein [Blastocatellia bacterium]